MKKVKFLFPFLRRKKRKFVGHASQVVVAVLTFSLCYVSMRGKTRCAGAFQAVRPDSQKGRGGGGEERRESLFGEEEGSCLWPCS